MTSASAASALGGLDKSDKHCCQVSLNADKRGGLMKSENFADIIYGWSLDARLLLEALEHLRVVVLPEVLQAQPDRLPLAILQGKR